jgi:hypothetical protein
MLSFISTSLIRLIVIALWYWVVSCPFTSRQVLYVSCVTYIKSPLPSEEQEIAYLKEYWRLKTNENRLETHTVPQIKIQAESSLGSFLQDLSQSDTNIQQAEISTLSLYT